MPDGIRGSTREGAHVRGVVLVFKSSFTRVFGSSFTHRVGSLMYWEGFLSVSLVVVINL